MLEVRKEDNGVWVGNGKKRVWISERVLNGDTNIYREGDNPFAGEVVYTYQEPLIVGHKYTATEVRNRARNKTIVVSRLGFAHQLIGDKWVGTVLGDIANLLPDGVFTVVWMES